MKNTSIWLDKLKYKKLDRLNEDKDIDALIIGGGITGLNIAYQLKDTNLKVCVVERNKIGHGVTARTTGKITYLQELIYTKLKKYHNKEISKLYLDSQLEAIKIIDDIVDSNNIDCNLEKARSYVYTKDKNEINSIYEEYKLLKDFKVDVKKCDTLPNGQHAKGIYVSDARVFHPIKYLMGLKDSLKNSIDIYEDTKVIDIKKENNIYICSTEQYKIKTKYVVVATHYPYFLSPFFFPLKGYLEQSYICAYKIKDTYSYSAITSNKPTESIRYHSDLKNSYKIVLSNSHNLCVKNNDSKNMKDLIKNTHPDYMWSNKDIITSDYLPYIGLIDDNFLIATGYNTWGMTNSALAGVVISDLIQNKKNKYIKLFDPKRNLNVGKILNFPLILGSNIKSFVGSIINPNKSWYKDNVIFKTVNGKRVGIYIDDKGIKHMIYNKCPHMKCGLVFNEIEKTWDCRCHGSRFDIDGKCIEGPSNYDISYKEEYNSKKNPY